MYTDDHDHDSDKENKDPSKQENQLQTTPKSSKKKLSKRKKSRQSTYFCSKAKVYPLVTDEGSYVFMKGPEIWHPGKIMQFTSPYNLICYSFLDSSITITSRSKLCSFLNYGFKVDFDLLESDEIYKSAVVQCTASFAEIHRPDLLELPDKDSMLLDWARLGFVGCKLVHKDIPQILVDYGSKPPSPTFYEDDEQPSTSGLYIDPTTPPFTKRHKLSSTSPGGDSGYGSSPEVISKKSPLLAISLDMEDVKPCADSGVSEVGCFVLGKLSHYGWWPGVIADPQRSPRPCSPTERLVHWFGDCTRSVIEIRDLEPITSFSRLYQTTKKGLYRVALYDFLSDVADVCSFKGISAPDSVNIDEGALRGLISWALEGFVPTGPPTIWTPTTHYTADHTGYKVKTININHMQQGGCVACKDKGPVKEHPLFEDLELCESCYQDFAQCAFIFGDDGTGNFCTVCNKGGSLYICDVPHCGRPYCPECIRSNCGQDVLSEVDTSDPWLCVLCCDGGRAGGLVRRQDWPARLQSLLTTQDTDYPPQTLPPIPPVTERRSIRVLSLFDGISSGMVALSNLGMKVEVYVSSEVDSDALKVSQLHHPHVIQIGDITTITPSQIAELGGFDLVLGGSPCNDLSNVNPFRKGIYEGTGRLFFEFYRILNYVRENSSNHVFWMFENVVSMSGGDKTCISRFLQCHPVLIDAKHVSCMTRARYFWGNLPGISRPIYPLDTDKVHLQDCLERNCGRTARFPKINCITTQLNSVKQRRGRHFPVSVEGSQEGDWLWSTEMERVFGLPTHYTDVANMPRQARQRLLGKSWSIPVLRHLFSPLKNYFKCN